MQTVTIEIVGHTFTAEPTLTAAASELLSSPPRGD
jgi:hypothetical protein